MMISELNRCVLAEHSVTYQRYCRPVAACVTADQFNTSGGAKVRRLCLEL
jgi:hypothetical protein